MPAPTPTPCTSPGGPPQEQTAGGDRGAPREDGAADRGGVGGEWGGDGQGRRVRECAGTAGDSGTCQAVYLASMVRGLGVRGENVDGDGDLMLLGVVLRKELGLSRGDGADTGKEIDTSMERIEATPGGTPPAELHLPTSPTPLTWHKHKCRTECWKTATETSGPPTPTRTTGTSASTPSTSSPPVRNPR